MKSMIEKLDTVYSQYIRLKYARHDGCVTCYTCGSIGHWKGMQCGHYIPRQYLSLRFDERNTKPQCVDCNMFHDGCVDDFREALIDEYGEEEVEKLENERHNLAGYSDDWYREKIKYYKNEIKKLC